MYAHPISPTIKSGTATHVGTGNCLEGLQPKRQDPSIPQIFLDLLHARPQDDKQ